MKAREMSVEDLAESNRLLRIALNDQIERTSAAEAERDEAKARVKELEARQPSKFAELMDDPEFREKFLRECESERVKELEAQVERLNEALKIACHDNSPERPILSPVERTREAMELAYVNVASRAAAEKEKPPQA